MTAQSLWERRRFLQFLAASPALLQGQPVGPITKPEQAVTTFDFLSAAQRALPPAHFGYMATGVEGDGTLRANEEGYYRLQLRPRRLVNVSKVDTSVELFGTRWESPIFLCPVGHQHCFHAQGEIATARAARSRRHLQLLSTVTSVPLETVARERGMPPWFQLYLPAVWSDAERLIARVEEAGCPVLVWTIDIPGSLRKPVTLSRWIPQDKRVCTTCHATMQGGTNDPEHRPMLKGLSTLRFNPPEAEWATLDRLRRLTRMKIVLKGIETREDAVLAREHGADGIIVSNHGGRATETLRPSVESLVEVVDAVGSSLPVLVDGGVRRGSDVFKALACGARAVGIGRPYIWGLSAFGQPGVERVLDLLREEFEMTMRQCGTVNVAAITQRHVAVIPR